MIADFASQRERQEVPRSLALLTRPDNLKNGKSYKKKKKDLVIYIKYRNWGGGGKCDLVYVQAR